MPLTPNRIILFETAGMAQYVMKSACGQAITVEVNMNRREVLERVSGERDFQEEMLSSGRPDMRPDLQLGSVIAAMEHNLAEARAAWYKGSGNHPEAMGYIRKVAALGVQAGESFGMPKRER